MSGDPVRLRITDTACPGGRWVELEMARERAEAIVREAPEQWSRYRLEIKPTGVLMRMAFLVGLLAFAKAHKGAIVALALVLAIALLAVAGIYLPKAHYRATPIAAGFLASFFAGAALGARKLDSIEP